VRVVFAGTPHTALPSLEAVAGSRHELVAVVTRPDAPSGRGRRLVASPVARRAEEIGVEVLTPAHPREPSFLDRLRALAPACCPVVAYGALLPAEALAVPPHGWVNLHFSLLPAWRGAAPVQRALWAGDQVTGATTFRIVPALDAGPTYGLMTEAVRPTDTAGDLLARLADGGAELLVRTGSRTAPSRPARSPPTGSAWRRSSPSRTRTSTGPSRPPRSTGGCARARPRRAPGRPSGGSGSRSAPSRSRPTRATWVPASSR
jgi:methionyl-tRNA formyltransferase